MKNKYTCIDLFAGAGGLSEGFLQSQKFEFLAHVEWEKPMVETLRNNLVSRWGYSTEGAKQKVVRFDVQKTKELIHGNWEEETILHYGADNSNEVVKYGLNGLVTNRCVDIIIGGPPCQAYSLAGRAQDPNSMKDDYRNYLFESFVELVNYYRPKLFVFENVPGMLSATPGGELVIQRIYNAFEKIGYEIRNLEEIKKAIYNTADFGVPQSRRRVIIIGVDKQTDYKLEDFYSSLNNNKCLEKPKTVKDAIGGLPKFKPLEESYKLHGKNISHEQIGTKTIDRHKARYNNLRDINVFRDWLGKSMNNIPNKEKLEYYYKVTGKKTNHNKYRNIEWDKPSPTIVSHLYKDGLMFIHPDIKQLRSITIREAALLQTFPIDFEFIGSDAYCFKMIGNAVPVLFAKKIAISISKVLENKNND